MDYKQLKELVVEPTLKEIGLYSESAVSLILGTIAQESQAKFLKQIGGGPALGIIQMEPATYSDIWDNYLSYRHDLGVKVEHLASLSSLDLGNSPKVEQLVLNLAFAVAMCRVHYLRVPNPLPAADDIPGLAKYWKDHYNTHKGAGKVEEFIENYPQV